MNYIYIYLNDIFKIWKLIDLYQIFKRLFLWTDNNTFIF